MYFIVGTSENGKKLCTTVPQNWLFNEGGIITLAWPKSKENIVELRKQMLKPDPDWPRLPCKIITKSGIETFEDALELEEEFRNYSKSIANDNVLRLEKRKSPYSQDPNIQHKYKKGDENGQNDKSVIELIPGNNLANSINYIVTESADLIDDKSNLVNEIGNNLNDENQGVYCQLNLVNCLNHNETNHTVDEIPENYQNSIDDYVRIDNKNINREHLNIEYNLLKMAKGIEILRHDHKDIKESLAAIQVSLDLIVQKLDEFPTEKKHSTNMGMLQFEFPMKSKENLIDFENKLKIDAYFKSKMHLSLFGGPGTKMAREICKFLFTDELLMQFSWAGKGSKANFSQFKHVVWMIVASVRKQNTEFTMEENKKCLMDYIKQSKSRLLRKPINNKMKLNSTK